MRPYRHRSLADKLNVSYGNSLPASRIDLVVLQRGGPVNSRLQDIIALVAQLKTRGAKLIYDLDDDLLATHPSNEVEAFLESIRPKVRFLIREADAVTVSTTILAKRIAKLNTNIYVWQNALDEQLVPPINHTQSTIDVGYFGTNSHLQDFMCIIGGLARSSVEKDEQLNMELCGISDNSRVANVILNRIHIKPRPVQGEYRHFHAMLATEARWTIGLAPLLKNEFNDAKSGIKALDYAAAGIPAIVSDVNAYSEYDNNKTIIRVPTENIAETVIELLKDKDRRRYLAFNAYHNLLDNHILAVRTGGLLLMVNRVLDERS